MILPSGWLGAVIRLRTTTRPPNDLSSANACDSPIFDPFKAERRGSS
jgi:hypothetical protein